MELFKEDKQGLFYNRTRGFWIENVTTDNINDSEFLDYLEEVDSEVINRIKELLKDD